MLICHLLSLVDLAFAVICKNFLLNLRPHRFSLMFSPKSFTVLPLNI